MLAVGKITHMSQQSLAVIVGLLHHKPEVASHRQKYCEETPKPAFLIDEQNKQAVEK